jgi:hypothetical protein
MSVTAALRRCGLDVVTSQEDGTDRLADDRLLERAKALGRILFTQDQDLLRIASAQQETGESFPGILFAAQEGVSLGVLIADLELLLSCCEADELAGRVTYLPLRA